MARRALMKFEPRDGRVAAGTRMWRFEVSAEGASRGLGKVRGLS